MVLVKIVFRMLCFWCVLGGMVLALNYVTLNRSSEGCIQLADFYKLDEEEVDVLCIGSSHVYYGINTCQLYDDYGIASYLLASPGQPVWISYYLLEEALKTQKPRLVIFDIGTLFRKEEDFGSYSWETLISMKPSQTKWNAIQAVNQYEECLDAAGAFFSFPYYHTRFLSLTSEDFYRSKLIRYNGYRPEFTAISESELAKWKDKIWTPEKDGEAPAEQTSTFADGADRAVFAKNDPVVPGSGNFSAACKFSVCKPGGRKARGWQLYPCHCRFLRGSAAGRQLSGG